MPYRKITVNETIYKYLIGKTHVKIKGVGCWPKEEIGQKFARNCECCGEPVNTIYSEEKLLDQDYVIRVLPHHIAEKIKQVSAKSRITKSSL
jgi:hypothetical protein